MRPSEHQIEPATDPTDKMFLGLIVENLLLLTSILILSPKHDYIMDQLPWICGAAGAVAIDVLLLGCALVFWVPRWKGSIARARQRGKEGIYDRQLPHEGVEFMENRAEKKEDDSYVARLEADFYERAVAMHRASKYDEELLEKAEAKSDAASEKPGILGWRQWNTDRKVKKIKKRMDARFDAHDKYEQAFRRQLDHHKFQRKTHVEGRYRERCEAPKDEEKRRENEEKDEKLLREHKKKQLSIKEKADRTRNDRRTTANSRIVSPRPSDYYKEEEPAMSSSSGDESSGDEEQEGDQRGLLQHAWPPARVSSNASRQTFGHNPPYPLSDEELRGGGPRRGSTATRDRRPSTRHPASLEPGLGAYTVTTPLGPHHGTVPVHDFDSESDRGSDDIPDVHEFGGVSLHH
ncbi:hypothetical protein T439DRAFT_59136 [Meredithblackwellia eburnea MCA 4105]